MSSNSSEKYLLNTQSGRGWDKLSLRDSRGFNPANIFISDSDHHTQKIKSFYCSEPLSLIIIMEALLLLLPLSRFSGVQLCATLPHRRQPTWLPRPWDSPGKNTGVGCHFLLQCMKVKSESEVAQSCMTLCDPMDCSLPGSSVHEIFQARVLEWGAIAFSYGSPRKLIYRLRLHNTGSGDYRMWIFFKEHCSVYHKVQTSYQIWEIVLTSWYVMLSCFCLISRDGCL